MICPQCMAAADLTTATLELPHETLMQPLEGSQGEAVVVILWAAVRQLHSDCRGCDCQHRSSLTHEASLVSLANDPVRR